MSRSSRRLFQVAALWAVALLLGLAAGFAKKSSGPSVRSVQVRSGQVRADPSFLSRVLFRVNYAVQVKVLGESGVWIQVQPLGRELEGWLHTSALTTRVLVLTAPDKKIAKKIARKQEMALAGRSFDDRVERALREKNPDLASGFAWLDEHLDEHLDEDAALNVSVTEVARFRTSGELQPLEEAGP